MIEDWADEIREDLVNAHTRERRRTMIYLWTETVCWRLRVPRGGRDEAEIRREIEALAKEAA